jgi:hypothetical protein
MQRLRCAALLPLKWRRDARSLGSLPARARAKFTRTAPQAGAMGDVNAGGISKLLQAEQEAQEIVNKARKGAQQRA